MPKAIGAARVPRRSFKTAYTSKKTKTMSATLRGSIIRFKYSVYGSSSNISGQFSSVKFVGFAFQLSTNMFGDRRLLVNLITARHFDKHHLDLRLSAFDAVFDLEDRLLDVASAQVVSQLHMRVDQNLFRRQVHRQKLNNGLDVGMTFDRLLDRREHLRIC